jgi:hypothetical protein
MVHYDTFPQFKAGLLEAGFPKEESDAKIDILFEYYKQARSQASLTLGRLADTQKLREEQGTAFEGGKSRLLLTLKASGFDSKVSPPAATVGTTVLPKGALAGQWKEWQDIHSHALFYLVSNISDAGNPDSQFPFNVTQRELIGLLTFGYSAGGQTPHGREYTCAETQLADAATFKTYVTQMELWTAAVKS